MSDDAGIYDGELIDLSIESFISENPEITSDSDHLSRCKAGANQSGTCLPQNECQRSSADHNQSTTNKSCDENKTNAFKNSEENKAKRNRSKNRKNGEGRAFNGSQFLSKSTSKPLRSNLNMSEGNCEDGNSRPRRSENASSDRPRSRKNQPPSPPTPDDSYDYDDYQPEYYMDADESFNWEQNNCNAQQKQQQQQQNHNTQQFCGQNEDEYQMDACDISTTDVEQRATSSTGDIRQVEENLVRIETQRLSLLQNIEQHQRALVEKTQQLLKNEQEQIKLRSEYEKRKMAEFQKQMDARMPASSQHPKLCPQANGPKKPDKDQPKKSGRPVANSQSKRKRLMYQPPSPSSSTEGSISVDEVNEEQRQQQQHAQKQGKPKKRIPYVPPSETDDSCFSEDFDNSQTPDTNAPTNRSGNENQCDCQPDISNMANTMSQSDNRKPKINNGSKDKRNMKKDEKTRRQNFTNEYYYLTPQEGMDDSQAQSSNCGDCKLSSRSLPDESKNNGPKRCQNRTR